LKKIEDVGYRTSEKLSMIK